MQHSRSHAAITITSWLSAMLPSPGACIELITTLTVMLLRDGSGRGAGTFWSALVHIAYEFDRYICAASFTLSEKPSGRYEFL